MKQTGTVRRIIWGLCIGISTVMLMSCMELLAFAVEGMGSYYDTYYDSNYDSSYTEAINARITPASTSGSFTSFTSYRKAPANVYLTEEGQLIDSLINRIWRQCEKEGVRDYDRNGKINCCDRATAFCIKWRQYCQNSIRLCQQMTNSLDHMYVQILLDGYGWWSVDPAYTVNRTHDMKEVWGWKYNRDYDEVDAYWITEFNRYIW